MANAATTTIPGLPELGNPLANLTADQMKTGVMVAVLLVVMMMMG